MRGHSRADVRGSNLSAPDPANREAMHLFRGHPFATIPVLAFRILGSPSETSKRAGRLGLYHVVSGSSALVQGMCGK